MVAASGPASQVSPDDLKAAPRLVFTGIAAYELDVSAAISRFDAQPCISFEHDTPGQQPCSYPVDVADEQIYVAFGIDSDTAKALIAIGYYAQLKSAPANPSERRQASPEGTDIEGHNDQYTDA